MYQVTKEKRIIEQLSLCNEDGEPVAILDIDIAVNPLSKSINKAYNDAILAQQKLSKLGIYEEMLKNNTVITPEQLAEQEAALSLYGEAVIAMFNLLFGEDNTNQILDFYENRYTEMSRAIFPFIIDVVMPAVEERNKALQKAGERNYMMAKKLKKSKKKQRRR